MRFGDRQTFQYGGNESRRERVAGTYRIRHLHLRSLDKRDFARGEHIAAVYAASEDKHLQVILGKENPALVLQVDARIAEHAADGDQLLVVYLQASSFIFRMLHLRIDPQMISLV